MTEASEAREIHAYMSTGKKTAKIWFTKKQFDDWIRLEVSCSKRAQYVDQIDRRTTGKFD